MLKTKIAYIFLLSCLFLVFKCKVSHEKTLDRILDFERKDFKNIVNDPIYKFQMTLTQISESSDGVRFESLRYNVDTANYYYPASSVKLPVAILALERLNEINSASKNITINRKTDFIVDSTRYPQTVAHYDSTTLNNRPNIENYINKIFAVSDNDAYNRLFEFLSADYINRKLYEKGCFTNSRIIHRVGVPNFNSDDNKYTNAFHLLNNEDTLYSEAEKISQQDYDKDLRNLKQGKAFYKQDSLIHEPFDFSRKNFVNLVDYTEIMKRIFYPKAFETKERFNLNSEQLTFLQDAMAKTPRQHISLDYDTREYYDSYVKFFMFGDIKKPIPNHIQIHNKVGYAYGYLTDIAFIKDHKHNLEYILCASVFVNPNNTFNDDQYEYESLGIPFLAELGRRVHAELERK